MNKIYKVKKNAAGHLVACSEFAKGHTKKAVLGSLLIVGILGMATTASAQQPNNQKLAEGVHIGGGDENQAKGKYSTIGGGYSNVTEAKGEYSTIGGGFFNQAIGHYSTVGGGSTNEAIGKHSTIGGGFTNEAKGEYSTVAGGANNKAIGKHSTVGGGNGNKAEGIDSTIAGGRDNQATGEGSFAAGIDNKANAKNAVALGNKNTITGNNSVAIGSNNTIDGSGKENVFILGSGTSGVQSNSVLLGNKTTGKVATTVKHATVNGLTLENFAGASQVSNGTVSVGSQGEERQIVNVGAGEITAGSTDAVNGSQLYALASTIDKEVSDINEEVGALVDDVANNQADIQDLDKEVGVLSRDIGSLHDDVADNQDDIAKNQADIKGLNKEVKDLDKEVGVLSRDIGSLHDDVADNQDDIAKNKADIKTLENNVEEELLNLSGRLIDQKADIAKNQADIAQNQTDIQDLAAYNELQDAYAKQQTEAIDALNKASSANTDRIATAELGIAENKKDAQIAKAQANENKDGIAKNQADIANNIKNIYELAQQQDQHSSDIKTLAKVSAANTDRIAKNKAEADASFETLTKNQNTLIEQGEALVEQNKAINQELEGFAAHADVQDKQILQNQADITTNKTAIEQNINRTVANGFEIEKNKAGIATNKQELILQHDRLNRINETNNHQDQKIDQLGYALKEQGQHFNNRISAVERQTAGGIANAIAIATLPSPSRAGEHHVLFGSGYHNGQAAVSLGAAGLSDTGKSTYKIGLSWSDAGGLSGGVGGSYRWK